MDFSSPVTGPTTLTGLTNPTYTLTADVSSNANRKTWLVTGLGGTQTGVEIHSGLIPFRVSIIRPSVVKSLILAAANVVGLVPNAAKNVQEVLIEKGVKINSTGAYAMQEYRFKISTPAGAPYFDGVNVAAGLALALGCLSQSGRPADLQTIINTASF